MEVIAEGRNEEYVQPWLVREAAIRMVRAAEQHLHSFRGGFKIESEVPYNGVKLTLIAGRTRQYGLIRTAATTIIAEIQRVGSLPGEFEITSTSPDGEGVILSLTGMMPVSRADKDAA